MAVLQAMAISKLSLIEARSIVKGLVYVLTCLGAIVGFAFAYRLRVSRVIGMGPDLIVPSLLGVLAELSLTALLTKAMIDLFFPRGINVGQEVRSIPWLRAVLQSPASIVQVAVVSSAMLEEMFFRGIVLSILVTEYGVNASTSIVISGCLFTCQQVVQLRTRYQVGIIGVSCIAISLVGGTLVLLTGSVLPAAISHASFVVFYLNGLDRGRMK